MALVNCKDCVKEFSTDAVACPHCGAQQPKKSSMKVIKWLAMLIIFIPLLLAAGFFIRNKAVGPQGWAEDNTVKELKSRMRDPASMVIRSSFFVQKTNKNGGTDIVMCGIVDGKNGFGAYAGGDRFISLSMKTANTFDTYMVQMDDDTKNKEIAASQHVLSPFEKVYWNELCVDAAHPPITLEH